MVLAIVLLAGGISAQAEARSKPDRDRLITYAEAELLLAKARQTAGPENLPLVLNDQVLQLMNRMLASRSGRATMRRALAEMSVHRAVIERIFRAHSLPVELLAIPIVESGYRNLPEGNGPNRSAGLWQFIKGTARAYGLKVGKDEDERLNVVRSTRAAAAYLTSLRDRFDDWYLAIAAYNIGEGAVEDLIESEGTNDPWQFARARRIPDYLARMMVAMLVMRDPTLLN